MKALAIFIVILSFSGQCFGLSLTQEQWDNRNYIDKAIREVYPQYSGFNGSKENMRFNGISERSAKSVIEVIDFDKVKAEEFEQTEELRRLREKIIDSAIKDLEDTGADLKHKNKIKEKLLDSMEV